MSGPDPETADPQMPPRAIVGPLTNDERLIHEAITRIVRQMKRESPVAIRKALHGLAVAGERLQGAELIGMSLVNVLSGGLDPQFEALCQRIIARPEGE